jgi:thiol-disulfide isomerase/thioredoxin
VLLTGCGAKDSGDENAARPLSPSSESPPDASLSTDSSAAAGSKSGPAEGGLELPDGELPREGPGTPGSGTEGNESGGPTRPGAGGIEMPDLGTEKTSDVPQAEGQASVQMASWTAIESRVKSTGKITVVDLWSTVCEPCVKEFPGLVKLSKNMPDTVTCVGVSVDYDGRKTRPAESYRDKVAAFLTAVGADFENFLCNTPSDDVFSELGLPSIPAVLIYDADGEPVKRFVDAGDTIGFSYEADVIPFVEKLAG